MSDDIVTRLREAIIADAVERREIVNGILAERLIRERHKAADEIENLTAERDALRAELAAERAKTYDASHHAQARLVALRECENELQGEEELVAKLRAELAAAKIEIEKQRARVIKWVNAAMRNEEYDDDRR